MFTRERERKREIVRKSRMRIVELFNKWQGNERKDANVEVI